MINQNYEPYWSEYLAKFNYPNETFNISNNTDKYAIIIEPRITPLLPLVIKNFMYKLKDKNWGLIIYHGINNETFIKEELKNMKNVNYINTGVINFTSLEYSKYMASKQFWEKLIEEFRCKYVLTFQIDTLLFKNNLEDFFIYDYVGAPWCVKWNGFLEVGNGGLSLRNTKKMLEIVNQYKYTGQNEDIYFSTYCIKLNYDIPSIEIAKKFSIETIFYDDPIGLHQPHLDKFPNDGYKNLLLKHINIL